MRVFFMGTPQLAVPVLKSVIESKHEVILVVTQPDKPTGRQRRMVAPPVKQLAILENIPVVQPATLKDEEFKSMIEQLQPDIGVVFAYGKIIPQWLLDIPTHGIINVHASLLPRWRGAAPIQRSIMAGDKVTGVTIMQMVFELDAGDILLQHEIEIGPDDTSETISMHMSDVASKLIVEALDRIEAGSITPIQQEEFGVTYAEKITDEDAKIDWNTPAEAISNQVRGLNPKPGAYSGIGGMLIKVWRAEPAPDIENGEPGTVIGIDKNQGPYVATKNYPLRLVEVQPMNKKRMTGAEFARGYRIKPGDKFDD